jgi:hypothetical protein
MRGASVRRHRDWLLLLLAPTRPRDLGAIPARSISLGIRLSALCRDIRSERCGTVVRGSRRAEATKQHARILSPSLSDLVVGGDGLVCAGPRERGGVVAAP